MRWPGVEARSCVASLFVVALASAVVSVSTARAVDADVEHARALLEGGDAAGAQRVVAGVEARTDLPASELLTLLVVRARVHAALGDAASLSADARVLVAVAPSWQAPLELPASVRAAIDEARVAHPAAPTLDVDVYPATGAARLVVEVEDAVAVVRGTRIYTRRAGEQAWHRSADLEVVVRGHAGERVEYYVEALGPGGVVVAREGSEASPKRTSVPASEGDVTGGLGTMLMADGESSSTTWLIAGGVAVAAIVFVVVLLAVAESDRRTDLGVPIVEWP